MVCHYCQEKGHIARGCAKKVTDNYKRRRENKGTEGVALMASLHDIEDDEAITNTNLLTWYVDSAASAHMCHVFDNPRPIFLGNGARIMAVAIGNVKIREGIIHNVLHVPLIKKNLLSVDALDIGGIKVVFSKGLCELWRGNVLLFEAKKKHGLYRLDVNIHHHSVNIVAEDFGKKALQWYKRFGHVNFDKLSKVRDINISNKEILQVSQQYLCESCHVGKFTRQPFNMKRGNLATRPLRNLFTWIFVDQCMCHK